MPVIDTFKKSHTPNGNIIPFVFIFLIDECCNPPDQITGIIFQDPSFRFAKTKGLVFFLIKNIVDVFVQRADPVRVVFI